MSALLPRQAALPPRRTRGGFTLLEVVIALAILTVSLLVLVDSQAQAVYMTMEGQKALTGTWLAEEKMAEIQLKVEQEGFSSDSIEEEGDFEDLAQAYGDDVNFGSDFDAYHWAYTVREVDLALGDLNSAVGELEDAGYNSEPTNEASSSSKSSDEAEDPASMLGSFIQPDAIAEMLSPYLREVRVVVWWGDDADQQNEDGCVDCVELTTHVINPSGQVVAGASSEETE